MPSAAAPPPAELKAEAEQRRRLRRMKQVPLVLLAVMAGLLVAAHLVPFAGHEWLIAFAEAALVGALADWFAVTALFRHPLGIPIPHTAIVPRRKNEIGASLARFVADHFLIAEALGPRVEELAAARRLAGWLERAESRSLIAGYLAAWFAWLARTIDDAVFRRFMTRFSEEFLDDRLIANAAGDLIEFFIARRQHQALLSLLLTEGRAALNRHREDIRRRIREGGPWWLPGFIDDKIVVRMFARIDRLLGEMAENPEHEFRERYHEQVLELAAALRAGRHDGWIARLRREGLRHPVVLAWIEDIRGTLRASLAAAAADPAHPLRRRFEDALALVAAELQRDAAMQALFDRWVGEALIAVIDRHRYAIARLISDTIAGWDTTETSHRIELAIGYDLQYIRINGTVVGGLVGLAIYAISRLLI